LKKIWRLDFSLREHEGWHDRFPKALKRHENVPTPQICKKFLSTSNCLFPSLALWLLNMKPCLKLDKLIIELGKSYK
jgi:hypothetical protein